MSKQRLWITWERQRRNRSMADAVGAELHELAYSGSRLSRYLVLIWRTARLILTSRPRVVFYQNPSIVLAALVAALKFLRFTRSTIVGDYHNAGVFPPVGGFLLPWIVRTSDLVIVSNKRLEAEIIRMGGRPVSIPDPLPHFAAGSVSPAQRTEPFDVLFICSWASDEPIQEVLRAAQALAADKPAVRIAITGRPRLSKIGWNDPAPPNVELTGFLSEHDFERRLTSCDLIIDLTTRADCMVCGAYEAVAAGTPVILSDNPPTREYFGRGALFTNNEAADIAQRIREARANSALLRTQVAMLRVEISELERAALQRLEQALERRLPA